MTQSDAATVLLPLDEAASRLGLHPSALRSRIRRGNAVAKKGNDGRILVEVAANAQPRHDHAAASPDEEMALEVDMVRRELAAAHLALVKAEGERDTAVARLQAERDAALATAAAKVDAAERVIVELRAMLADARRPWWRRLVGA